MRVNKNFCNACLNAWAERIFFFIKSILHDIKAFFPYKRHFQEIDYLHEKMCREFLSKTGIKVLNHLFLRRLFFIFHENVNMSIVNKMDRNRFKILNKVKKTVSGIQ